MTAVLLNLDSEVGHGPQLLAFVTVKGGGWKSPDTLTRRGCSGNKVCLTLGCVLSQF